LLYLHWHSVEGHTRDTITGYSKRLSFFLCFLEERGRPLEIDQVTSIDILAFLDHIKRKGDSPSTVRSRCLGLKAFFNWAVEWELIHHSPAAKIRPPKVPKVRKPFLAPASFRTLLDLCPLNTFMGARRQSILWLFATTGMRLRELASLNLEDLDWEAGLIRVMGKGQKERRVPFHKQAQLVVLRYLSHRTDDLPCLWLTESRTPLTDRGLSTDMAQLMRYAGLKVKDRCHIFRRTWAAHASRQGIPVQYTLAVAGWSTPRMLDDYTRAMQEEEAAAQAFQGFSPF
jgi:site-specific recombinase XerD